ncbi:MAG TPA: T9SS type A sorting domain-containing protein, partial [Bacteroidales bacterium]|nr:T9SS type A sorting domain-containing protein [Bacteroidales bacterium]
DIITYVSSVLDTVYNDDTLRTSYGIHKIQLPYETDFSLSPAEILMKQVIGTATWEVESDTGDNPAIAPVYGTGRLTFHSESGAGSIARAIFNGINLLGTHQPKLEFWYAHDNSYPTKRDFVAIKISTDGINTQLLDAVYRYDQTYTSPGWAYYTIDLSAYVNEPCVSLIFEGNSFGGANQNIDRIRISSSQDISLTYLSPKVNNLVACNLDNQTVRVIVSNLTSQRVDFNQDKTDIHFYVSGADTVAYVYPLSGILAGLASDTVEITHQLNLSRSGIYDITAYLNAIDGNTSNDTTKNSLFINPDLSIQDIVGVDETNCKQIGDSVYVSFKIVNIGNLPVDEIPLSLQINGVNKLNDTLYKRLDPGDYINYSFTKPYVVPEVSDVQPYYYVKIKTDMPCDALTSNNIKEILACVDVVKVVDIKVSKINHPVENPCDTGLRPVNVSVTLSNEGNVDIEKTVLHVEVDSSGQPHASFSETTNGISAKSTITHIFTQSYLVPNQSGNYKLKVYVENVSDDNNPDNDSLEINPCAIKEVGVADYEASKWSMGQNIPNPAKGSVDIPFSIPQAGNLQFTIRSISGQILYTRNIQGIEGNNMFTCDITAFADGIYYYSMEYQGQRMTKKITILH